MSLDTITIEAKLSLYATENGGRNTGIKTGYRPNHVFEYIENSSNYVATYIGQIDFDKELILPNETSNVRVTFLNHHNIADLIKKGRIWWIHESDKKIGEAIITKIQN